MFSQRIDLLDSIVLEDRFPIDADFYKVKGEKINYLCINFSKRSDKTIFFEYDFQTKQQKFIKFDIPGSNSQSISDAVRINDALIILQGNEIIRFKIKKNRIIKKNKIIIPKADNILSDYTNIYKKNANEIYLFNQYNFFREDKLYDDYRIAILNLKTGKIKTSAHYNLGKGIVSSFNMGQKFDSYGEKSVLSHPTKLEFYLLNNHLIVTDTIYLPKYTRINTDSVFNTIFTDSYLKSTRTNPNDWFDLMNLKGLYLYPHIEKIGWLSEEYILISALNVKEISPTRFNYSGQRILFLYNLVDKTFSQIEYDSYKKIIPLGISINFHANSKNIMAAIQENYTSANEISRMLHLTRFYSNNSSKNNYTNTQIILPDSANNINGEHINLNYKNINRLLFVEVFSCIKCFSSKDFQNAYVFVVDRGNIPIVTKRGIYSQIKTQLNPKEIFFLENQKIDLQYLNTIIRID